MATKNEKILVVDDEPKLRKLVGDFLIKEGYETEEAGDGEEALNKFLKNKEKYSLIILDVMMPKMDGWETLEGIRSESNIPVVMLTAKGEEADEVKGFKTGANDYVQKPFSPRILIARINAILNRREAEKEKDLVKGIIKVDKMAHQVFVSDKEIELSFKEFELLTYLMENEGIALTREKLLSGVWDYDYFGDSRTIDTHIKKLRAKLGDKAGEYIKTIWGMGYKFKVDWCYLRKV